jgi:hypothetical protein
MGCGMADGESTVTVSQVQYELKIAGALISSLRQGLDFLARDSDKKILYLVDYPEISAYWESWRPNDVRQLETDRVKRVWDYLTGLEQILTRFDDETTSRLRYIQRAHEDQAEYIDALLLSGSFNTMISPPTWRLLRDDIVYFSRIADVSTANWNTAIESNRQDLRERIGTTRANKFSERLYVDEAERFGFASLARKPSSTTIDLLRAFVEHANFRDPIDLPWELSSYHIQHTDALRKSLSGFDPQRGSEKWMRWIDKGSELYNEAYGHGGRWARRKEGAETLAYLEFLSTTIAEHNPNLRVAFVTRNHQYHHMALALSYERRNEQSLLIFHPRLLSAFMIKQAGELAEDERQAQAVKARSTIDELSSLIETIDSLVGDFTKHPGDPVSKPLRYFVRYRLLRGWTQYRQQSLAEQVRLRIQLREGRWGEPKRNDNIGKFLRQIVAHELTTTQIAKELALLEALPNITNLVEGIDCTFIPLSEDEYGEAVLFRSDLFTHPFKFHSISISQKLASAERGHTLDIFAIAQEARSKIEKKYKEYFLVEKAKPEYEIEVSLLRFDLLLLFAVLLAEKGEFERAYQLIGSARAVWLVERDIRIEHNADCHQLLEALYLEALIRRLEWRLEPSDQLPKQHLENGVGLLNKLIAEGKQIETNQVPETKRFRIFEAAFCRELYGFSGRSMLRADLKVPYSIDGCIDILNAAYTEAMKTKFTYVAMRARQHYLAFARMADAGALNAWKFDRNNFSREKQLNAFEDFEALLVILKAERVIIQGPQHFSVLITELNCLWKFRDDVPVSNETIKSLVNDLKPYLKREDRRNLSDWASALVDEIEASPEYNAKKQ